MKIIALLIFTIIFCKVNYSQASRTSQLQILNVQAWDTYLKLENNLIATAKELGPKPKGFFSSMSRALFTSKPKYDVQIDLNELAQIYGALNSADISALSFLKQNCRDGDGLFIPATDPMLCQEYPEILLKQIQNRLDVINSKVIHSDGILKTPPRWLYHLITATELLKEIDSRSAMEQSVRQGVGRSISPEDSKEFDTNPNILNDQPQNMQQNQPHDLQQEMQQNQPQVIESPQDINSPPDNQTLQSPNLQQNQSRLQTQLPDPQIQAPSFHEVPVIEAPKVQAAEAQPQTPAAPVSQVAIAPAAPVAPVAAVPATPVTPAAQVSIAPITPVAIAPVEELQTSHIQTSPQMPQSAPAQSVEPVPLPSPLQALEPSPCPPPLQEVQPSPLPPPLISTKIIPPHAQQQCPANSRDNPMVNDLIKNELVVML